METGNLAPKKKRLNTVWQLTSGSQTFFLVESHQQRLSRGTDEKTREIAN